MAVPKEMADRGLVSTGQVAKALGVHRSTVWYWIRSGLLPHEKVGEHYGVRPKDVIKHVKVYKVEVKTKLSAKAADWEKA